MKIITIHLLPTQKILAKLIMWVIDGHEAADACRADAFLLQRMVDAAIAFNSHAATVAVVTSLSAVPLHIAVREELLADLQMVADIAAEDPEVGELTEAEEFELNLVIAVLNAE